MNIIFLFKKDQVKNKIYKISDERFRHINEVLKSDEEDILEVGFLNGPKGSARVIKLNENFIELEIINLKEISAAEYNIDLICALPRPQTLKKILPTIATIGVRKLHLIRANRVEKSYFQSPLVSSEKQFPYLLEGLSQGKLTRMPEVTIHNKFRPFFENYLPEAESSENNPALKVVAHPDTEQTFYDFVNNDVKRIIVAIGPEGGWVPFEIELMERQGFSLVNISNSILRVETAVTASLAQIELVKKITKSERGSKI